MVGVRHLTTWVALLALLASLILVTASYGEPIVFEVSDELIGKSAENVDAVSLILQPEDDPRPAPPRAASRRNRFSSLLGTNRTVRMQRAPAMFGDIFARLTRLDVFVNGETFFTTAPLGSGATRSKVSENNRALTDDRCYFLFNHFHNALQQQNVVPNATTGRSITRYTFGYERSFHDLLWSVELRIPLASAFEVNLPNQFIASAGSFGNIAVIVKRMLWERDNRAICAGVGLDLPTGSDIEGLIGNQPFVINNDATHVLPFIGFTCVRSDVVFCHGFFQLDLSTNSNTVNFGRQPQTAEYEEQNLMQFDVSAGAWLYKNPNARHLTGVAALFELHYTTTLQDTDVVNLTQTSTENLVLQNAAGQIGVLNFTTGIHAELGNCAVRIGGVFPFKAGADQRFFDAELWLSIVKSM